MKAAGLRAEALVTEEEGQLLIVKDAPEVRRNRRWAAVGAALMFSGLAVLAAAKAATLGRLRAWCLSRLCTLGPHFEMSEDPDAMAVVWHEVEDRFVGAIVIVPRMLEHVAKLAAKVRASS